MNIPANRFRQWILILTMFLVAGLLAGCDDTEFDRDSPAGQGTLVVDNWTWDRVQVYIDGQEVESVTADKHRYYDLAPGLYRVALDGDDTDRFWIGDVDVLEGRRIVLQVRDHPSDYDSFGVRLYFD